MVSIMIKDCRMLQYEQYAVSVSMKREKEKIERRKESTKMKEKKY